MSSPETIEGALLEWSKSLVMLVGRESEVPDVSTLSAVQQNQHILCGLLSVLIHDGDEAFDDIFAEQIAAGRSNVDLLASIVKSLESKYDRKFEDLASNGDAFSVAQLRKLVELALGWAMLFGPEDQKQKYIEYIFELNTDYQQALMLIIQEQQELAFADAESAVAADNEGDQAANAKQNTASPFASSPAPSNRRVSASAFGANDSPYSNLARTTSTKKARSSRIFVQTPGSPSTPSSGLVDNLRTQLRALKSENMRLHGELADTKEQLKEREEERVCITENSQRRAAELKKMMRAEMAAIERENQLKEQLQEVAKRNKKLREQAKDINRLKDENRKLLDDNAVLNSLRARLDKSDHMVAKLKERLLTHDDLVDELRRVQEINAEHLAKIDSLTMENTKIPTLEAQVLSYKRKVTDTKVEMSLAVAKNREMQKEIETLLQNQSGLQSGLAAVMESNCNLVTQQMMTEEADSEMGVGTEFAALGSAMSEVNPEVREKLVTLERENKIMKEKLGKTDLAAVDQLEEKLADAEQLRDAFEGKYVACTAEIKKLQGNVKDLTAELSQERQGRADDLVSWEKQRQELRTKHEETMEGLKQTHAQAIATEKDIQKAEAESHAMQVTELENRLEAEAEALVRQSATTSAREETIEALKTELQETTTTLTEKLTNETNEKNSLSQQFEQHKTEAEETQQRSKIEMLKMQADTKKLFQSYTKVTEKSKQRATQIEQLHDEIKGLKKKISRLERERGLQESRLRMKQQSEELEELKTVVADYKKTLKDAKAVQKNIASDKAIDEFESTDTGAGGEESLAVARKRIDELSNKHRQLLFNNVELTMKKAEIARTLNGVMREKSVAQDEITRLKVHIARVERAAKKAGLEVHPLRKVDGSGPSVDLDVSFACATLTHHCA